MRSGGIFDYEKRKVRVIELTERTQNPEFWSDPANARVVMQELDNEKSLVKGWDDLIYTRKHTSILGISGNG